MTDRTREIAAQGNLPRHIAVIMDGNGRWAERQGKPRIAGHQAGMKAVREVIETTADLGIPYLTLYAFSQENWKRPRHEIEALMGLLQHYIRTERKDLIEKGIRVRAIGDIERLAHGSRQELDELITDTAANERLTVTLALSYGGRSEIVAAVRRIASQVRAGELDPEAIDEEVFADRLYTADLPDPDLLIRTSGELRISNFLLWQIAYTELYVTDVLWPDFDRDAFLDAVAAYQGRERRFGRVLV
ncbi:MAG TPA: isoprenyl transferase [Gemmatimonadota bacterium]|jgi:undecaprenyl diphosphate synthase|nr:isoprenyl transferase [Gemmatimonadota bacterium]